MCSTLIHHEVLAEVEKQVIAGFEAKPKVDEALDKAAQLVDD